MRTLKLMALAATLFCSVSAQATQIFFGEDRSEGTGSPFPHPTADAARAAFMAHLVGVGTENFETFATGATGPLVVDFGAAGTATLGGSGNIITDGSNACCGRFATSGVNSWEASSGNFTLTFSNPIAAFGFYGVDIGDFNGQITVTLANGAIEQYTVDNTVGAPNGSVLYWAIINVENPFTSITFGNTNSGVDYFGFDDFTIGTVGQVLPVPEPASLGVFGLGFAAAGFSRRRRKA